MGVANQWFSMSKGHERDVKWEKDIYMDGVL